MILSKDTSKRIGKKVARQFGKTTFVVFITLLWGCIPSLQEASTPQNPDSEASVVDYLENQNDNPLIQIVEDSLEQTIANEMELTASEEITLPSPEESLSLENAPNIVAATAPPSSSPVIEYDFPIVINSHVEFFLDKFQNSQHELFKKWLERSGRYLPMIQEELKNAGLPLDLAYLPMIESGYRLTAYSKARAVGPWQFMRSTGRSYKLTINNYVDERRDPIKSTRAAIKFLTDLYREFDSWPLAVAAYNAGGGRVRRAIRKTGSNDFWQIIKGSHLKKETKYYVPKLIAAIIIAKDPESYGFKDIVYDEALEFETLEVPRWTTLQAVALACDEPLEDIHNLNRQLRRIITPPGKGLYQIRVPIGKKESVAKNLPRVKATITTGYKSHVIRKGDTVTRICNKYNINKKTLLKANNLRSSELIAGKRLRIPYQTISYKLVDESIIKAGLVPAAMLPENLIIHEIKPGETISELAKRYNVPPHMIASWNGLENLHQIRAGQQLAFYLQANDNDGGEKLLLANQKTILQGNSAEAESTARHTYYNVIAGDTLRRIAQKFQTTPEQIRRWNNIEGDIIYPGNRLLLKTYADIDV